MKRPISDRAEIALDFPEKCYYGSFDRDATYDLKADGHGVHIDLDRRTGQRRHVGFHLHFYLLADIFDSLSETLPKHEELTASQWDALAAASAKLDKAIRRASKPPRRKKGTSRS